MKTDMKTDKRVLIYGGFDSVKREIQSYLPAGVSIKFVASTHRRLREISLCSILASDAVFSLISNISHSSAAAVRDAARRHGVPFHQLQQKGAASIAREIERTLLAIA